MLDNLEEKEDLRALNSQIKNIEIEESERENDESKVLGGDDEQKILEDDDAVGESESQMHEHTNPELHRANSDIVLEDQTDEPQAASAREEHDILKKMEQYDLRTYQPNQALLDSQHLELGGLLQQRQDDVNAAAPDEDAQVDLKDLIQESS